MSGYEIKTQMIDDISSTVVAVSGVAYAGRENDQSRFKLAALTIANSHNASLVVSGTSLGASKSGSTPVVELGPYAVPAGDTIVVHFGELVTLASGLRFPGITNG